MNSDISRIEDLPVVDIEQYLTGDQNSEEVKKQCQLVAQCFHDFGILLIRDPRAKQKDNSDYIDLMEKYFESRGEMFYNGQDLDDAKPEYHYQVGVCPKQIEIAKDHSEKIRSYGPENQPVSPLTPVPDAKWRFMWKIGNRPEDAPDNFPQVIP